MATETTSNSERKFQGKLINLRLDTQVLEDGKTFTREVVEHRGAVGIIPVLDDGSVVMVRQFRPAVGEELLEIVAGTLEEGENPDECAVRELAEETGLKAERMECVLFAWLAPGYSTEGMHFYIARGLSEAHAEADEDEDIKVERVPLDEVIGMIATGLIRDSKSVAGLLLADRLLRSA